MTSTARYRAGAVTLTAMLMASLMSGLFQPMVDGRPRSLSVFPQPVWSGCSATQQGPC